MTKTLKPDDLSSGFFMPKKNIRQNLFQLSATICLIMFLFSSPVCAASEPLIIDVEYDNDIYTTSFSTTIHAPPDTVYRLLTSYDRLHSYSRLIYKSELLSNGHLLLKMKACFIFICFDKKQTLSLDISERAIVGHIIPQQSDFESGTVKWQLSDSNANSRIHFSSELTPDFWVPPFIGPFLIKNKLKNEAVYGIRQLELLSNQAHHRQ